MLLKFITERCSPFILACQFFTRIPIPLMIPFEGQRLRKGTLFLPIIGCILGILLWLFALCTQQLLPDRIAAALTLIFCVYLTGGLHLDGLIDTADGVYSQRQGEKMLTIITDSRIGAFGALAVILLLILKFNLIYTLFENNAITPLIALTMIWSRWILIWVIVNQPYYTPENGIGSLYEGLTQKDVYFCFLQTLLLSLAITFFSALPIFQTLVLLSTLFIVNIVTALLVSRQLKKQLGGLTGDVYGAINELCEVMGLLVLIAVTLPK